MANKGLALGIGFMGLVFLAAKGGMGKSNRPSLPVGGPDLTAAEKGRVEAGLTALRALVTAPAKDRANLIAAFQHAARIPVNGTLDSLTMEAATAVTQGQVDGDAIMAGLRSLVPAQPAQPPAPRGDAPPADMPAPKGDTAPATPPATVAANLAEAVTRSLETSGAQYDRNLVRTFQGKAGIAADGLYGPNTRAALIRAGIDTGRLPPVGGSKPATPPQAPKPATPPQAPKPAAPPQAPLDGGASASPPVGPATVASLAEVVARNLELAGPKYDRAAMANFQKRAALKADGLYGPKTRAALIRAGIAESRLPAHNFAAKKG